MKDLEAIQVIFYQQQKVAVCMLVKYAVEF